MSLYLSAFQRHLKEEKTVHEIFVFMCKSVSDTMVYRVSSCSHSIMGLGNRSGFLGTESCF